MYSVYFIGNDELNYFDNLLNMKDLVEYVNFHSYKEFINSNMYGKIFTKSTELNISFTKILIYDETSEENIKSCELFSTFDKIYSYEYISNLLNIAFNNCKKDYETMYYANIDYNFINNRLNMIKNDNDAVVLISGLSYGLMGIDESILKNKGYNFSLASQDLYYSYKLSKKIISTNNHIKYCVISLSYYSLFFDLSLCSESFRINSVYYPLLSDSHHYTPIVNDIITSDNVVKKYLNADLFFIDMDKLELYFKTIHFNFLSKSYFNTNFTSEGRTGTSSFRKDSSENEKDYWGYLRANGHNKLLSHQNTADENIKILSDFLNFLTQVNIKPIFMIFPSTDYYTRYLNKDFANKLFNVLDELRKLYVFSIIDLNSFNNFTTDDFFDVDHLNSKGAVKATTILNDYLN